MGAARRKGKWVGGTPVLGYDIDPGGGRLVINEPEAQRVREIFRLFQKDRSLRKLVQQLETRRWTNKTWKSKSGVEHVGRPFTESTLRNLLTLVDGEIPRSGQGNRVAVHPTGPLSTLQ